MAASCTIRNTPIGDGHRAYLIAEMACSHEGDLGIARHLIDVAADSGADAVQFQIISREDYIVPQHKDYVLYGRLRFSPDQWRSLFAHAATRNIAVFAAAYDRPSADLASECGVDAYKLHSADLSNPYLTQYIAAKGRPVTLGTGGSTIEETAAGIQMLRAADCRDLVLMHGFQNFPTRWEDVRLRYLQMLRERFPGVYIGYQDHTDGDHLLGFVLPMIALGMGVHVLEKHFTHDRAKKGIDHESALNPDELRRFVEMVREVELAVGSGVPGPLSAAELKYRAYAKKSIVAARAIRAGEQLTPEMLVFKRSTPGMSPTQVERLVGRRARCDIPQHANLSEELVE